MMAGNYLISYTNRLSLKIHSREIEKKANLGETMYNDVYLQTENQQVLYLNHYNIQTRTGEGVLFQTFKDGQMKEEIRAEKIIWAGNGWRFLKGSQRIFTDSSLSPEKYIPFERTLRLDLKIKPEVLTREQKLPEEMSYQELKNYVLLKQKTGQDVAAE